MRHFRSNLRLAAIVAIATLASGCIVLAGTPVVPGASPATAGSATPTPGASPTPVGRPYAPPSATPTPSPSPSSPYIFHDGFESGLSNWSTGASALGTNPLGWKARPGAAQEGNVAVALSNGDATVPAGTNQSPIWFQTKAPIDLSKAAQPMLRLYVKNQAVPASSVTFHIVFSPDPIGNGTIFTSSSFVGAAFNGSADWTAKDVDLSSLDKKVGYLAIVAEVSANGNAFDGPMVDNVTVYDAASGVKAP